MILYLPCHYWNILKCYRLASHAFSLPFIHHHQATVVMIDIVTFVVMIASSKLETGKLWTENFIFVQNPLAPDTGCPRKS